MECGVEGVRVHAMTLVQPSPRLTAWRLVMGISLLAWFVKYPLQTKLFFQNGENLIYEHSLIPDWLCRPDVGALAYLLPGMSVLALWSRRLLWLQMAGVLHALGSLIMLWHVQSYNDATHVTGFWTGLWLWWWAGQVNKRDGASLWHGISLAMGVLSLCWLGGAVGKLTAEYWEGEPFYYLYFMDKPQFPFSYWREHLSTEQLHTMARWFSRAVVVSECVLATSFFWPARLAAVAGLLALTGMVIISQLQLFSVLGPLMGLSIAVAWLVEKESAATQSHS